ncbi:MAG TPA: ABC transporter permease, partial [Acidimicrobiales bacterium]|nr:ABC transporter permease [Acidimicrobiales bacterium]
RNPKRTSSTAAALMIGVGLVGFVTIFAASAQASVDHVIDSEMKADYIVNTSGPGSTLPPVAAERIGEVPGVAISSGLRTGAMKFDGSVEQVEAIDPAVVGELFDVGVTKGSLADLGTDGLAVYEQTAKDKGWTIGSKVPVRYARTGPSTLTVRAIYDQQALAGSYVISLADYERNFTDQSDSIVMIKAEPGQAGAVRSGIEKVLKQFPNGKLQDRAQFKAAQAKQIDQVLNLIYALLLIAIIIAVFGIGNTLALSILERTHEIGLLRAVGMTRSQVRSTVRWEAVIVALFGTFLGLLVGVFFGWVLVRALADEGISRLALPLGPLVVLVVLGALVGTLAAWLPARRAAKLDILRAVGTE